MNALNLDDQQHMLKTKNIEIENSESNSGSFDSNGVLEQLLCFSSPTSLQNSDSDPEYLPSKKTSKTIVNQHHQNQTSLVVQPKSTCRRSARLSSYKDENSTTNPLLSTSLPSEDPEYLPPKGILNALKKSVNDYIPKSEIITSVKQRKLRRSKKVVDPACGSCSNNNNNNNTNNKNHHENFSMSCESLLDFGMSSSPLSTEELRQILEDSTVEEVTKKENNINVEQTPIVSEIVNHDSKGNEETTLKMPRTRSSLKLKVKKKDKTGKSDTEFNCEEVSDSSLQYKVSKDKVLPKTHVHKESKKVLKKRKRQTCRKQFRHKDITLYKLGADPDPVNEPTQKNHVIHKIFLRRSSVSTPPLTPHTSKVNKYEEVSENLLNNASNNSDDNNKCYESSTVKEKSNVKNNSPNCDLNNSKKIYCSSISTEDDNIKKVPKVILTPINTKDSPTMKDNNREVPQLQIKHQKIQDMNSNFKKGLVSQTKLSRIEVGKHNLPIRIPERRTSIAEALRTPPVLNNMVPSFNTEFNYTKIEIKNGLSDNQEVIYIKPSVSETTTPVLNIPSPIVSKPLHNEQNKEHLHTKENLPTINTIPKEIMGNFSIAKPISDCGNNEPVETSQETRVDASTVPENLSIKVVKSCSGIRDPLKLHRTNNLPNKKIDSEAKGKGNNVLPPKENNNNHHRVDEPYTSVSQTIPPMNSNELSYKSSPILQQNLLNGSVFKSDIYRNSFHNRNNIALNNFNTELSSYALNSLAMNRLRSSHSSNTVPTVSRNMPIIEETNQQISNDNPNYESFASTSPLANDPSKRNKKTKRKLSRSDTFDEIAPKLQRPNNYSSYSGYNYPLSFYSGTPPNPTFNPLSQFPLGIPHSVYNMGPPVYQPKPSNCTGQSPTFDRSNFRNIIPPPPSIINPFLAHDPRLPSPPTYSSSNSPVSKSYDSRLHYNHFMRFSNPMFMNHNTLPPDYSCLGINNRRNEALSQNTPILPQGFGFSSKNSVRSSGTRQSPHQTFTLPENTHRRSVEVTEPQSTPLALVKNTTTTPCNNWSSSIPITSRNEELTITKLPLRENLPKPEHIFSPGNHIEDLILHPKQSDGNSCSIVAISKGSAKHADFSGHPCSITNPPERRSVGSVLHGELANVSISIIKNINEKPNRLTSLSQQGLLPILEQAKLLQEEQSIAIPVTTKASDVHYSKPFLTIAQNVQPTSTLSTQKDNPKANPSSEINKTDNRNVTITKTLTPPIQHDVELETNSTKTTKSINSNSVENINSKRFFDNSIHNNTVNKLENKIISNEKVDQKTLQLNNLENCANPEQKLKHPLVVTVLSDIPLKSLSNKDQTVEAINLSMDKPSDNSSVDHNESVPTSETVLCTANNSPKSNSVNTIASVMQDILHQGDVKKFDQYVEALRRFIENREMLTLDAIKQNFAEQFFNNITSTGKTNNLDEPQTNNFPTATTEHPKIKNLLESNDILPSKSVTDFTENLLLRSSQQIEDKNTEENKIVDENISNVNFQVTQIEAIFEHVNTPILSTVDSQPEVAFESIPILVNTPSSHCTITYEPENQHSSQSELITTTANVKKPITQTVIVREFPNIKASLVIPTSQDVVTKSNQNIETSEYMDTKSHPNTEESRNIVCSQIELSSQCLELKNISNSKGIEDPEIPINLECTMKIHPEIEQILNRESIATFNDDHQSTQVLPQSVALENTPISEQVSKTNTIAIDFMRVKIKQEIIDEDNDVIFVSDSRAKVIASTEDKGVQADILPEFPVSSNVNYVEPNKVRKKKWKYLEGNSLRICKPRIQRKRKGKQSRNRKKGLLLNNQYIDKNLELANKVIRNNRHENTTMKKRKLLKVFNDTLPKPCQNTKGYNDGTGTPNKLFSNVAQATATTSENLCHTTINSIYGNSSYMSISSPTTSANLCTSPKSSRDGSYMSKSNTTATTSTKPCQTITNDLRISKRSTITSVNLYQTINSTVSDDGSYVSKDFADDGFQIPKDSATTAVEPCQITINKLSDDASQVQKTITATKPNQKTINKLSGDASQMPKALTTTSTEACQTTNKLCGDNLQIPKVSSVSTSAKPCQIAPNKLTGNNSQMSKISTTALTKPSQTTANKLSGNDSQMSKASATTSRKPCKTIINKLSGDISQMSTTSTKLSKTFDGKLSCDSSQIPKVSATTFEKPCQATADKLSSDSYQILKTSTAPITKPCQSTTNKNVGDGSQTATTLPKQCQTIANRLFGDGSQMSKASTTTSTEPCQNTTNKLSGDSSQLPKTSSNTSTKTRDGSKMLKANISTKLCQSTSRKLSGDDFQISKASASTKSYQVNSNKRLGDSCQVLKTITSTKPCQTANSNLSDNVVSKHSDGDSQMSTTPIAIEPCKINNIFSAEDSLMSEISTINSFETSINRRFSDDFTTSDSTTTDKISNSLLTKTATTTSVKSCQSAINKFSDNSSQISTKSDQNIKNTSSTKGSQIPTKLYQTATTKRSRNISQSQKCKKSKINSVNKRISKRLLLKKGIKISNNKDFHSHSINSKPENTHLLSPSAEEVNSESENVIPSTFCTPAASELPPPTLSVVKNDDYILRNSEIIQNRCFVRLSRISDNSKVNDNHLINSKMSINTSSQTTLNKSNDELATDMLLSNSVQKKKVSAKVSEEVSIDKTEMANDNSQDFQNILSLSLSSCQSEHNNNQVSDSIVKSDNVSCSSPVSQKLQNKSPLIKTQCQVIDTSGTVDHINSDNEAAIVNQLPRKSPPVNKSDALPPSETTNNSVVTPQKSPPRQLAIVLPTENQKYQTTNVIVRTPQSSPNTPPLKQISSFSQNTNKCTGHSDQSTENSSHTKLDLTKHVPQMVCAQTNNKFVPLPQISYSPKEQPKQIFNASTDSLEPKDQLPFLRRTEVETTSTVVRGKSSGDTNLLQDPTKSTALSKQSDTASSEISKVINERTQPFNQTPLSEIASTNNLTKMTNIPYGPENTSNGTMHNAIITQQCNILSRPKDKNMVYSTKKLPSIPQSSSSRQVAEIATVKQASDEHLKSTFQQTQQQVNKIPQQILMSSPNTSKGSQSQSNNTPIPVPQKSPTVIKTLKSYDITNNSIPSSNRTMGHTFDLPENSPSPTKAVPEFYNPYNSMQLPKGSPNRMLPHGYQIEKPQKPDLPKTSPHNFNSLNYHIPPSYKSPQNCVSNLIPTTQNSFINRGFSSDYDTSMADYRRMSCELVNNNQSSKSSFQQPFNTRADFYGYGSNGYQIGTNSATISQQSPPSTNYNPIQMPQTTTSVGRTSYQISKTPPMAHRRANNNINRLTNTSVQLQQPPSLYPTSNQVTTGVSEPYMYRNRNAECEIDLTVASKATTNQLVGKKDPKVLKRNPSKGEDPLVSSATHQSYAPFHGEGVPFHLYPPYLQKNNENRAQNEFAKKGQNFIDVTPLPFAANQEMRQNSYSSSSSTNSQFSPTFRQPPVMVNKSYSKSVNPKQDIQMKNKENPGLRQQQALEQNNLCELQQSQSSGPEKSVTHGETNLSGVGYKKRPQEDQNYLNMKAHEAHHFSGNLSPDYGYFSPLTRNLQPNYEPVIYRPNPVRCSEANSLHNIKYAGVATAPQHTPMQMRETYHNLAPPSVQNNNNYIRQNSKLPTNTSTLPMANGLPHKVQQPDVDKISSILPKLQQSETLTPEQYVLEMNVLEKDGCPRPFLEFYSFVTKKQIASYQLPISFRIFLEFQNAGKLKNFENAFRVYAERHEKEKTLMLKN